MLSIDERNILYWQLLDRVSLINPKFKFGFIVKEMKSMLVYKNADGTLLDEPDARLEARIGVMLQNELQEHINALQGIVMSPNYDNFAEDHEILYINEDNSRSAINRVKA